MIIYHGTYKDFSALSFGTAFTTSLGEAAAYAALACHTRKCPIENAKVFIADMKKYQLTFEELTPRGATHYSASWPRNLKVLSYSDLRKKLTTEEWSLLHASADYLNNFVSS